MIEEELRAAFARQESLTPAAGPLRAAIDRVVVRRRRRRLVGGSTAAALAVLAVVSLPFVLADRAVRGTGPNLAGAATATAVDGARTFLLLGTDSPPAGAARADTVLIVHLPRDRSGLYLIAVPRDAGMPIPGHGTGRINSAYYHGGGGRGGLDLTRRALAASTGLRFDGAAALDYAALRRVTDALGGVRMCLADPVRSKHTGRTFPAGCQQFDGGGAVDLLRQRYGLPGGVYDRDRNGQRFVRALVERAGDTGVARDPLALSRLLAAAGKGLTIDAGDAGVPGVLGLLGGVKAGTVVGIGAPEPAPVLSDGKYYEHERFYPGVAAQLFAAVREDRLAQWLAAHPDYVTR